MKYCFFIIVIIFLCVSLKTIGSVKSKSKLETTSNASMMEYLSSLYTLSNGNENQTSELSRLENNNERRNHGRKNLIKNEDEIEDEDIDKNDENSDEYQSENESEAENEAKPKKKPARSPRRRRRNSFVNDDELKILKQGWLRISSKTFLQEKYFPRITKPNFNHDYVDVTPDSNFRKNSFFNAKRATDGDYPPSENSFFFRLSKRNLYYSLNKKNLEALGALPIRGIIIAEPNKGKNPKAIDSYCFYIRDKVKFQWELCAESAGERAEWICRINELKNIFNDNCKVEEIQKLKVKDIPVTVFERKVNQPIILIPQPNRFCNDDWNYDAGGEDWECDCAEGSEQSPIDIVTANAVAAPIVPVFTYTEVEVKISEHTPDGQIKGHKFLKMKNKNHMLQIKADSFGQVVTLDGTTYAAKKIVFHTPSEHKINGKQYPMEMQVIHHGISDGAISKNVVLSFLFVKTPGVYNKFIDDLDFFNLPNPLVKEKNLETDLYIPKVFYNSDYSDIPIMKQFSVYTYQGSLTSPPCSENTIHYVAADPIELGSTALELFQEANKIPDMRDSKGEIIVSNSSTANARQVKPLNGRNVYYFKVEKEVAVLNKKKPKIVEKPQGHYEKVIKRINNYYFVKDRNPSGMPGAVVVSEKEAKGLTD